MTPEEKKVYEKAEKTSLAGRKRLLESTRADLVVLLQEARAKTVLILAGAPSDYQQWRAAALQAEIDRVLAELGRASGNIISDAAGKAWQGGIDAIDGPLESIGLRAAITHLDTGQLLAMRSFMVERITDISAVAASAIKRELGLAMIGSQTIQETIAAVKKTALGDPSVSRATTIVRTELGRAWAVASDGRAQQSVEAGIAMDKIWRRSGKIHSRLAHDLADGQRVPSDKPFKVAGIEMRFPLDPAAPAVQTSNCGCIALYRPRYTRGTHPDKRPFTPQELRANLFKAELQNVRDLK